MWTLQSSLFVVLLISLRETAEAQAMTTVQANSDNHSITIDGLQPYYIVGYNETATIVVEPGELPQSVSWEWEDWLIVGDYDCMKTIIASDMRLGDNLITVSTVDATNTLSDVTKSFIALCPVSKATAEIITIQEPGQEMQSYTTDQTYVTRYSIIHVAVYLEYNGTAPCTGKWLQYGDLEYHMASNCTNLKANATTLTLEEFQFWNTVSCVRRSYASLWRITVENDQFPIQTTKVVETTFNLSQPGNYSIDFESLPYTLAGTLELARVAIGPAVSTQFLKLNLKIIQNPIYQYFTTTVNASFDRPLEIGDCVIVDFGNGQKIAYSTEFSIANCTSDPEFFIVSSQIWRTLPLGANSSIAFDTNYQNNGTFTVSVRTFTWYINRPSISKSLSVIVISPPCNMPYIELAGISDSSANPTLVNSVQKFRIEGNIQTTCTEQVSITKQWILRKDTTNVTLITGGGITVISTVADFAPGSLSMGDYEICFKCTVDQNNGSMEACGQLRVVSAPLLANFGFGTSTISIGPNQSLTLDAYNNSQDPNIGSGQPNFSFIWSCKKNPSKKFESTNGTCFNKDTTALGWSKGTVVFSPVGDYMSIGHSYDIKVNVSAEPFKPTSKITVTINVIPVLAPPLLMRCDPPCLLTGNGVPKLSKDFHSSIIVQCDDTCPDYGAALTAVTWDVHRFNPPTLKKLQNDSVIITNQTAVISVKSALLPDDITYSFEAVDNVTVTATLTIGSALINYSTTYLVNKAPMNGKCMLSPYEGVKGANTMVKLWCEDWTDPDTVATWDFYRSDSGASITLLKSSLTGEAMVVLPTGVQQLTAIVGDSLKTDTVSQTIATINASSVDLSSLNVTKELDALDQEANPTKMLSYVSAIVEELNKNGVGFQSNMELLAVRDAISKYIASDAVPPALKDVLRNVMENAKDDPDSLMDLVNLLASDQLNQANSNMTQEQLVNMVNGLLKDSNDAMANVVTDLVKSIGQVPMITPDDLMPVINTVNSALSYATSITLNTAPTSDQDGALQGVYNVIAGYIDATFSDLTVVGAVITIQGETVYIRGDLRPSKSINEDAGDYVQVKLAAPGSKQIVSGKAVFSDSTQIDFMDGQAILLGNTTILDCRAITSNASGTIWSNLRFTLWNATWNTSDDSFTVKNGRLTAWMPVDGGELVVNSVVDGDGKLRAGGVLAVNSMLLNLLEDTANLTYSGGSITIDAVDNATFSLILKDALNPAADYWMGRLADPVRIELLNNDMLKQLKSDGIVTVPAMGTSARIVSGMIGMAPPIIQSFFQYVGVGSFLQPQTDYNETALSDDLFAGKLIALERGVLYTKEGKTLGTFNFAATVSLEGSAFKCRNSTNGAAIYIQNAIWKIDRSNTSDKVIIELSGGTVDTNSQTHIFTLLETTGGTTVTIDGGRVYRNASDGYVITDAHISFIGPRPDERPPTGIVAQSLISEETQQVVAGVMNNAADVIDAHYKEMSEDQLNDVAQGLLQMTGTLAQAIVTSLDNPLQSDLDTNYKYDMANYDNLFIPLPMDRTQIRYIEEYTPEQWAAESTKLKQQQIASDMLTTIEKTMNVLEEALIDRATAGGLQPASISMSAPDGTGFFVGYDKAADVFKAPLTCDDWTVVFPPLLTDLNIENTTNDMFVRVTLLCIPNNPYSFADNAPSLVNSGSIDVQLKDKDGIQMNVTNATKPIEMRGTVRSELIQPPLHVLPGELRLDEAIRLHVLRVQQWNASLFVEFDMSSAYFDASIEVWLFLSFDTIPGPLERQHMWAIRVPNENAKFSWLITSPNMVNRTGLFYIGVGQRFTGNDASSIAVNDTSVVVYNSTWAFLRNLTFEYSLRAITKGCFFYDADMMLYNSQGIKPDTIVGERIVSCKTNHLTPFAVGLFTPPNQVNFDYKFVDPHFTRNILVVLGIFLLTATATILAIGVSFLDWRDHNKSRIFPLVDNNSSEKYLYLIAVDTGYRMHASCESNVSFILSGTKADTMVRRLGIDTDCVTGEIPKILQWGETDRFLMATKWPLGDLTMLRIWHDSSGKSNHQSWYCSRVMIKDLQTDKVYTFDASAWLGSENGDGKLERLIPVTSNASRNLLNDAMHPHEWADHLLYFSLFTGGGTRDRQRLNRVLRVLIIYAYLVFCGLLCAIYTKRPGIEYRKPTASQYSFYLFGYRIDLEDFILGIIYALAAYPLPLLCSFFFRSLQTKDEKEVRAFRYAKVQAKDSWHNRFRLPVVIVTLALAIIMAITVTGYGISFQVYRNTRWAIDFTATLLAWLLVVEPIKAFLCALFYQKIKPERRILGKEEKDRFVIHLPESFKDPPNYAKNSKIGKSIADLEKLEESKDERMRDEQLYETVREILTFVVSLVIMLNLAYRSRQVMAFYYQADMRDLLYTDPSADVNSINFLDITRVDDFWNWTQTKLVDALLVKWYNGEPAWGMRGFLNDKVSRAMGYGTIRQVRSTPNTNCKIVAMFRGLFHACHGFTNGLYEDTTPAYAAGWQGSIDPNRAEREYIYHSASELQGLPYLGQLDNYGGGGYIITLNGTATDMAARFKQLQNEGWIDDDTRAVFVEFSVYNGQMNYFTIVQMVVEVPPLGAFYPNVWIEPVRLLKYEGGDGFVVFVFEILFCCFAFVLVIKEARNIYRMGVRTYFTTFWNWIDIIILVFSLIAIVAYVFRYLMTQTVVAKFAETNGDVYCRLDYQRNLELYFLWLLSLVVFFSCMKMMRILRFNRRIGTLAATLKKAAGGMMGFAFVFGVLNTAFNSALYFMLSSKVEEYHTYILLMETTFSAMLGKFSFESVLQASSLAGIVFIVYMCTTTILLLNFFIMVLMAVFEEVHADALKQTNDYEVMDHLSNKALLAFGFFKRHRITPIGLPNCREENVELKRLEAKIELFGLKVDHYYESEKCAGNLVDEKSTPVRKRRILASN